MKSLFYAAFLAVLARPQAVFAYDMIGFMSEIKTEFSQRGVAVAAFGDRVYLLDSKSNMLYILDENGKTVASAGGKGVLDSPEGLAVSPRGNVYVADTGHSRVQVFGSDGKHLRTISGSGSAPGRLSSPKSVAVGLDGRVYVSDTGNHRVQVFTAEGVFLFGFGSKGEETGQFKDPGRIAVDASDSIYVLDSGNERLLKFKGDTSFAKQFALHGSDFALDRYGFLYMLDGSRGKIKEVSPQGVVLGSIGTEGSGRGQFKKPLGIAVGPQEELVVVDTGNKRIQRISVSNKLKTDKVEQSLRTKLLVTGPTRSYQFPAKKLTALGDKLIAYDGKSGPFVVYGADGKEIKRFGLSKGSAESVTGQAGGLAASAAFGIFVSDEGRHRIQHFGPDGEHRSNFGATEGVFASRKKEGRVKAPQGVAVNEKGSIYVADTGNRRVDAFGPDGIFLFGFGPMIGAEELLEPVSVAWDPAGFVYVLDRKLKKVFKCEPSGGFIKSWGGEGEGVAQFEDPVALAYDGRSYLYVLDKGRRRISVFDGDGGWVTNFFAEGEDERSLSDPEDLVVSGSTLTIADHGRGKIVSFRLHPLLAPPVAISSSAAEGQVVLKWAAVADPLAKRYRVERSTRPWGPFVRLGVTEAPEFRESEVEAQQTYWYRTAVVADTGDVGPPSRPIDVFIPAAFNKAPIEISTFTVGNIFSSNYKWYLKNPIGSATIVNNMDAPFKNVKFSFRLKDYMDFATEKVIDLLKPKESVSIPLLATLNNSILEVTEDTPIQAEFTVTFYEGGKKQDSSVAAPLKVYSRNAITWEDPRRISNYITPKDEPVLDLSRNILLTASQGPAGSDYLNGNLSKAIKVWSALGALGIRFLPSPNNPFEAISEDPAYPVDYTQFPRETLRRRSGECDDLVTLIASILEGATVKTAVIDYPGHLALMFDTGSSDPLEIGLPADQMVKFGESYWVPLEATMVGKPFEEAALKGLFSYKEMAVDGRAKIIDPRVSWDVYEPATLGGTEPGSFTIEAPVAAKSYSASAGHYLKQRYEFLSADLKKGAAEGEPEALNRLGILDFEHGRVKEARVGFEKALKTEPGNSAALNNLGNLALVEGQFSEALKRYAEAAAQDGEDAGIWMNLTRAAMRLGDKAKAEEYSKKAVALSPSFAEAAAALLKL